MLTYKLIDHNSNTLIYKYYPYGKDIKVQAGEVLFDCKTLEYQILKIAELDEKQELSENEVAEIISHINHRRKQGGHPILTKEEFLKNNIEYIFAEKFITAMIDQIKNNLILEKGIIR